MRRNGAAGRHDGIPVLLAQLVPHVRVQRNVERANLLPQPVHFLREIVRRHVVLRAPHGAIVGESQLPRALVREFHVAHEVRPNRRRNGVPAAPHLQQPGRIAALGHDARDLLQVHTFALVASGAVLAFAVGALHPRGDPGQFPALLGIGGRGQREREFQQFHLARQLRRQRQLVEPRGLLGEGYRGRDRPFVGVRRQQFRVARDVGRVNPVRALVHRGEFQHPGLRLLHELSRFLYRWFRAG